MSARRIQIEGFDDELVGELRYLNARARGGTEVARLPIVRAAVGALGEELDAIVACSDLQGIVRGAGGAAELLGVEVAAVLEELAFDGVLPPAARTGVILAGDLFSVPAANKRGGYGAVADVWRAFAERFAWVAGVAGNHDDVSGVTELAEAGARVHLLDGDVALVDGLRIGGVGGIIGSKPKPGRRIEEAQLALIDRAIDASLDVLVLHEGPDGGDGQRGNGAIRSVIEAGGVGLTICGHDHWRSPLASHEHGQILNVDTRVVVMTAPRRDPPA
jgi:Icc-related predicted phosphoesterase